MHITGTESVHMMRKLQAATTNAAFSRSWRLVKWNFILKRKGNGIATPTTLNMMIMSRSFYVGDELKQEDIKAKYQDGILKLSVPKEEPKKVETTKHIAIEG